jgi:hypothetical protein
MSEGDMVAGGEDCRPSAEKLAGDEVGDATIPQGLCISHELSRFKV